MNPRRPSAKTSGGFNVTTSSQVAVADNPSRLELTITNNDTASDVSLALRVADGLLTVDPVAVAGDGIILKANGGSWTTVSYTGPVAAIAGAGARIAIVEI